MKALLLRRTDFFDASKPRYSDVVWINPGEYEIEEIVNPRSGNPSDTNWYVLKGTLIGCSKQAFLQKAKIVS